MEERWREELSANLMACCGHCSAAVCPWCSMRRQACRSATLWPEHSDTLSGQAGWPRVCLGRGGQGEEGENTSNVTLV